MGLPGDVITSLALLSVLAGGEDPQLVVSGRGAARASAAESDPPQLVVSTRAGRLRGRRSYIPSLGRDVDEFLGVPFAQPPLADLRFRHPLQVG